jgi:small subunit ribosomal protein S7
MARRRKAEHREIQPDSLYADPVVGRIVSTVMKRGKRSVAERIVYDAINSVNEENKGAHPLEFLNKALDNIKPKLEVKARRVGGATYQIPMEVSPDRQTALAVRWLVTFASTRKGVPMMKALANEIKEAAAGQGNAVRKRDEVHRMAQANRAFAHLRW